MLYAFAPGFGSIGVRIAYSSIVRNKAMATAGVRDSGASPLQRFAYYPVLATQSSPLARSPLLRFATLSRILYVTPESPSFLRSPLTSYLSGIWWRDRAIFLAWQRCCEF